MAAAGANMPYVGFTWPLLILSGVGALFATFYLTRGVRNTRPVEEVLGTLPEAPGGWNIIRAFVPFVVMIVLIMGARIFPAWWPVFGLPMIFMLSGLAVLICSPKKVNIMETAMTTVKNLKELVGIMVVVGVLNQILTLTGRPWPGVPGRGRSAHLAAVRRSVAHPAGGRGRAAVRCGPPVRRAPDHALQHAGLQRRDGPLLLVRHVACGRLPASHRRGGPRLRHGDELQGQLL